MYDEYNLETEWRLRAACRGLYGVPFYPKRGESSREAKAICETCPVVDECLEDAIERREMAGIRGGMSTRERRRLIKQREAKEQEKGAG